MTWRALLDAGKAAPAPPSPPKPDDLCTIMYTSGTTGRRGW
jgi:long-chain acyl-CoA synthetase